jgi:hypothetical protein
MISALSAPKRPKPIGAYKHDSVICDKNRIKQAILDTLEELADSTLGVETYGLIDLSNTTNPHIQKIEKKYGMYLGNAHAAIGKLENRSIAMINSELYLKYFMREKFTDR